MHVVHLTFEDFNGNTQTRDLHFHLSKTDLIKLAAAMDSDSRKDLADRLTQRAKEDAKNGVTTDLSATEIVGIADMLDIIIMAAYGIKSEDGMRFDKSDEIREAFKASPMYSELFMSITQDQQSLNNFMNQVLPKDVRETLVAELNKQA